MNKHFFNGAFLLGAALLAWVAVGFILGAHVLALAMTLIIAAVYAFGALELRQFRQATATLTSALEDIPAQMESLDAWLGQVHASLRNAVRLRTEGERIGLPGPALTPYLVGLLVMLGMLGTFLGMVVTLNGAVFALEGTTDLAAMRAAFATPIKGLGLAFGTSVAGVASSALLGLMSAFSRRERLQAAQLLDTKIATTLRSFSLTHQRQQAFQALQAQSQALPAVVHQLQAMMLQMEHTAQQLNERLISNQESFHGHVKSVYTDLALSVDKSLRDGLSHSAQIAGDSLKPVVQTAMHGIAQEAKQMHLHMVDTAQLQLDGLSNKLLAHAASTQAEHAATDRQRLQVWTDSLEKMAATVHQEWQQTSTQTREQQTLMCDTLVTTVQTLSAQSEASARTSLEQIGQLMSSTEALVRSRIDSEATWTQQHTERMDQIAKLLQTELGVLRDQEALRGDAAVARLGDLQTAVTQHLSSLGTALEEPLTRMIQTAAEAPRAAAEVIGQLRQEISNSAARDNELLEERSRILETLNALLASIRHASVEQREVIDSLVASSAVALQQAGSDFSDKLGAEASKLADVAAHVSSSAVEVSSLSDAFGLAVRGFAEANDKLIGNLQRIEGAMDKSMLRSDEQLAYYVAQAREIIDLSISSQKQVFDELRQLPLAQAQQPEMAEGVN